MMRIQNFIIILIIIVFISLTSSCKKQKENEKESWDNFYNTIEQIKKKNENKISKAQVSETIKKESRGTEIINGKITEIKGSSEDDFMSSTEWPDYDRDLWDFYNSDIDIFYEDFLKFYDEIVESDNSGQFDSWRISQKINILIRSNQNLEDVKKQIKNHKIIVGTQYRIDERYLNVRCGWSLIRKHSGVSKILVEIFRERFFSFFSGKSSKFLGIAGQSSSTTSN